MCGRFQFSVEESKELRQIMEEVQKNLNTEIRTGEIFPTNLSPILTWENGKQKPELYKWGFPKFRGSGVIINARVETILEKPMFRKSMEEKRCVIPTSGFFEWSQDGKKQKYLFRRPGEIELYLAGIYNVFQGTPCFVVLTTQANESVAAVHSRMPVILSKDALQTWTEDFTAAMQIANGRQPALYRTAV